MDYDPKNVQRALMMCGFSTGGLDGVIGPQTTKAIKEFQSANGVDADGVFGPITAAAMAPALEEAMSELEALRAEFGEGA